MKILMVLTSHDELGDTGRKTGFWLEEFAAPYYAFLEAGADITVASPKGGKPPLDPKSDEPNFQTEQTRRFHADPAALTVLTSTVPLASIWPDDYDAVFYPGGHGPLWDLTEDKDSIEVIESLYRSGKPIAFVCHAPGVLRHVKAADGGPLVKGRQVTGFKNSEEDGVGLTNIVPFLVEDVLKENGGIYSSGADWSSYAVQDGLLITGQNPGSSVETAGMLIDTLKAANAI